MPNVLLLTGPGGAGKTTVATALSKRMGFAYLDGDREDTEFFPAGGQWLPEKKDLLKKAHEKILRRTREFVQQGNNVVIDYIIFGRYQEFIASFRRAFGEDFSARVLFPSEKELIRRDVERVCWTTGPERIRAVFEEFASLKDVIGEENYLDTTKQTPEETIADILRSIP